MLDHGEIPSATCCKVIVGGVVSEDPSKTTVTVKLAVPTFPAASVATQVMVVVPIG